MYMQTAMVVLLFATVSLEEDVPSLVESLTHPAKVFPELEGETITQLSVSNFITTAVTSTGKVFWW